MNSLLRFLVLFVLCRRVFVHNLVKHYVNLIEKEISKASVFTPPTDLSEFKVASNESQIYGYYDYIIVGAGSTGAVLANRLSENQANSVLLLEVGGPGTEFTDIPGMFTCGLSSEFNWNYATVTQKNACLGRPHRQCLFPRGKGLGGSSLVNAMLYVRGHKENYNDWSRQGNPGWSYEEVLPYFIKSENSNVDGDKGYHGRGGNLNVEYSHPKGPLLSTFIDANIELGRKVVDYNGKEQLGVARTQFSTIYGRRDSTAKAFLLPAIRRKNLRILTRSLAIKILIAPKTKVAYGVLFSKGGRLFEARVRKEIIVSAGVIGSPQLLMLSGIGPRKHLQKLSIPVIQDLAVGKNIQDHVTYALDFNTNYTYPIPPLRKNVKEYLNGYGPFTLPFNMEAVSFVQTKLTTTPGVPDIQITFRPGSRAFEHLGLLYRYDADSFGTNWNGTNTSLVISMSSVLFLPESRGEVTLRSKDPYVYPLVDPRFFSDPKRKDLEKLYQGVKMAIEIMDTSVFKKFNATPVHTAYPACRGYKLLSREYWYCQFKHQLASTVHASGTCKMGPDPAKGAVVDAKLRVHGIKNLRVGDASIMPSDISAPTNSACVMIGEKLSDMIRSIIPS